VVLIAHGELGQSAINGLPIGQSLAARLPVTLLLLAGGAGVALAAGVPLGLLFAWGSARKIAAPILQIVTATPVFCAGLALAYGAVHLAGWPVRINPVADAAPDEALKLAALPILTVGLAGAAAVQLALRRAATGARGDAYREGLKRLGLQSFEIETLYVLPRILAGLLAEAGEIALALVSAAVVAEWVFHAPGVADLFVKSVALADWDVAAVILFLFALLTLLAEFLGRAICRLLVHEGGA